MNPFVTLEWGYNDVVKAMRINIAAQTPIPLPSDDLIKKAISDNNLAALKWLMEGKDQVSPNVLTFSKELGRAEIVDWIGSAIIIFLRQSDDFTLKS
jgi:hypothetical protein